MRTYDEWLILEKQAKRRQNYAEQLPDDETLLLVGELLRELLDGELARRAQPHANNTTRGDLVDALELKRAIKNV